MDLLYFIRTGYHLSVLPFVLVVFPIIYNGLIRATISEFSSIFHKDRLGPVSVAFCFGYFPYNL